jgi:hypothetical protein
MIWAGMTVLYGLVAGLAYGVAAFAIATAIYFGAVGLCSLFLRITREGTFIHRTMLTCPNTSDGTSTC